ncbi:glycosyltransferase family 2 protein [Maribacter sp. PR1]|uniref:Glycosyltransferase family 2 protein n=1 Tax=Maribacter cobaltidurans TaxID=1178778 RepID=A0ABU7INW1_9FLAO|nr:MULTISPECIES: glycosyltransferase family 2 protein [Maribacter]MDC6387259.1 glycosyltransferase family 2 protein [Maribacter sp. PR1]MEE1974644.1 glycosyltransferase family 2 protein [Maribacter cobaltidurans]
MEYYVIIPAHNEEAYLKLALESITLQTLPPKKVVVVNDNSTDNTEKIIDEYTSSIPYIQKLNTTSSNIHLPGSKVVNAFQSGLKLLDEKYDFLVKLDADIILPADYFEKTAQIFSKRKKVGIAGGFAYEQNEKKEWKLNHPMDTNHVRGAFKAYSKKCFNTIGGLKRAMGWDTVDELLAQFHGFEVYTDDTLKVKHLRPTGKGYNAKAKLLQGKAMYSMRYGFWITLVASIKMAYLSKNAKVFIDNLTGYLDAQRKKEKFLVTKKEGKFIRSFRWKKIKSKLMT